MAVENPRGRKLAKLVPNHVFRDKHWNELFPIVNGKGDTYHFWYDRGTPGPGLNNPAVIIGKGGFHFFRNMPINKGTFFQ